MNRRAIARASTNSGTMSAEASNGDRTDVADPSSPGKAMQDVQRTDESSVPTNSRRESTGPPVAASILSDAVMAAVGQLDTKLAFEMMLLSEQINSLDTENKCMKEENSFLKEKLAKQTQEMSEMYNYFHGKLDQHVAQINDLERALAQANESHDQVVDKYEHDLAESKSKSAARDTESQEKIHALEDQLKQLHEFVTQKNEIEAQVQALTTALEQQEKAFEQEKLELERKRIFEKERLKKEMLTRMKETKEELLLRTEDQLNTTTKRTMMENEYFMEELSFQSKEAEKLMTRCSSLEDTIKSLRIRVKVLEDSEAMLAKKNCYYQKILKQVRANGQRVDAEVDLDALEASTSEPQSNPSSTPSELVFSGASSAEEASPTRKNDTSRNESIELRQKIGEQEAALHRAQEWLRVLNQEKQFMLAQQDEIIEFLRRAVEEINALRHHRHESSVSESTPPVQHLSSLEELVMQLPPIPLDDLNSEDTLLVLRVLLAKLYDFQQRMAPLYTTSARVVVTPRDRATREAMLKQLELPPIHTRSSPTRKPPNYHTLETPASPSLLAMATTAVHFGSPSTAQSASPLKHHKSAPRRAQRHGPSPTSSGQSSLSPVKQQIRAPVSIGKGRRPQRSVQGGARRQGPGDPEEMDSDGELLRAWSTSTLGPDEQLGPIPTPPPR